MADLAAEARSFTGGSKLSKRLQQLHDILKAKGIDLEDLDSANIRKVGFWQAMHKDDATGEAIITDLARIELSPAWDEGPKWPVIQPGPRPKVRPQAKRRKAKGWQTAALLPDMQVGYYTKPDGTLEPTHDEAAIEVALAIVADVQPAKVVLHGDNADFAEMSRFRLSPAFQQTTQAAVDRLAMLAEQLRTAAPDAEIVWLEGNHEARLPFYLLDNAKAAFGLRKGMDPQGWPVLSMPHLCGFAEAGIVYESGYPANEHWLNDNFRVIHGNKVRSNGSTAYAYLDDARVSTAFGHVHRRELAQRTRHTRHGPRTVTSVSFGCLARVDGAVPSTKGGISAKDGTPVRTTEDWQNGMGLVHFEPGDGMHAIESVEIVNGWARFQDTDYRGSVTARTANA